VVTATATRDGLSGDSVSTKPIFANHDLILKMMFDIAATHD
jgi:hypothetical protein